MTRSSAAVNAAPARLLVKIAVGALAVALATGAGFAVWYRTTYWVWPGQGASDRVHWCGRDYQLQPGRTETWRQISAQQSWPVHVVGLFPPLAVHQEALFAGINPQANRSPGTPVASCAALLYIRAAPGRYLVYSLLGGP